MNPKRKSKRPAGKKTGPRRKSVSPAGYAGLLRVSGKGHGFFEHPEIKGTVEIFPENLGTALHGDEVEISLLAGRVRKNNKEDYLKGEVRKVVVRARSVFVGVVEKEGKAVFLVPDDRRFYTDILLPGERAAKIPAGYKAAVRIKSWTNPKENPEGEVVKVLGEKGRNEVEMEAIIIERGFEKDFPSQVLKEAEYIKGKNLKVLEEEISKRLDMREVATFTIDPADAKDFDDALSFRLLPEGETEVGVHIADVSHYVREGTSLDEEAKERGFSVYLVDRTIPMLPNVLSDDLCSLKPGEDKLTFSAVFTFGKNDKLKKYWLGKTVIHSNKRFSYEEAQSVLDRKEGEFFEELKALNKLAEAMREDKFAGGAIAFEQDEIKFELDEAGRPLRVYKKERLATHLLVEDFMLLANRKTAEHVNGLSGRPVSPSQGRKENGGLFIYRVHDLPDRDKIDELSIFLKALGHELETSGGQVSSKDINRMLKAIEGREEETLIKTATVRSMAKAAYSTKNIGHYGLAFKHYTHFTSPIRRYPDLLVHRLLERHLKGQKIHPQEFAKYEVMAIRSSQKEIEAVSAERDSIKYKQVEYMAGKVGKEFTGIIAGVTDWGIYVEEDETRASGLVPLRDMDDYFALDGKNYSLVGEKTGKTYRLGDKVRFKVASADLESRTLDYKLL